MNTPLPEAGAEPEFGRREQLREVLVFLFLIAPSMGLSFLAVRQGSLSFRVTAIATILRDLGLVSLVLFFLWRNGERVIRIGWTMKNAGRDLILGAALFLPLNFGAGIVEQFLKAAGFTAPATPTPRFLTAGSSLPEFILAAILVSVVAVAEEIIFRGYLILRLKTVIGGSLAAALVSSIVFSLGHGYEGAVGVITVGYMGLFFALVYLTTGSLVAPMAMHFLQDFTAIVVLPFLKHHS